MKEIDRTIEELELLVGLEIANAEVHHKKTDRFFPALVSAITLLRTQQGKTPDTKRYDLDAFSDLLENISSEVFDIREMVKAAKLLKKSRQDKTLPNAGLVSNGVTEYAIRTTELLITTLIGGITRIKGGK